METIDIIYNELLPVRRQANKILSRKGEVKRVVDILPLDESDQGSFIANPNVVYDINSDIVYCRAFILADNNRGVCYGFYHQDFSYNRTTGEIEPDNIERDLYVLDIIKKAQVELN